MGSTAFTSLTLQVQSSTAPLQRATSCDTSARPQQTYSISCRRRCHLRQRQYIDESNGGLIRECRMFIPGLPTFRMGTRPAHLRRRNTSRHVSAHRLERAKALLTRRDQSLLDIASPLNFSSQANFTRALLQEHRHDPWPISARFRATLSLLKDSSSLAPTGRTRQTDN
jgi:AraC family transcriptional regulator